MLVDRDGLLWVGSREGLFRYDGYHATPFLPDADLPGTISDLDIRALYEAADGALWVQDAAAALPATLLAPRPGDRIADLCAAPGGKTGQLAAAGATVLVAGSAIFGGPNSIAENVAAFRAALQP